MKIAGMIISTVGYLLAIYGGWLLYANTAPDHGWGTIPITNDLIDFQQQEQDDVDQRSVASRRGFAFLTLGASLQLAGTLISGLLGH
jgi:hypothetical protein